MWALAGVGVHQLSHTLSHLSLRVTQELIQLYLLKKKRGQTDSWNKILCPNTLDHNPISSLNSLTHLYP